MNNVYEQGLLNELDELLDEEPEFTEEEILELLEAL